ncbi:uncharacterized protein BT62DRAFT_924571 [Guyanagaster necrorhizus]|uniref:PPM-type phosphatase domain-containing protein n=1 Tax=Guyanagaster necrorhizus TaxID=856835 RepID=A0A9P7VGF9_9AGAR|nr:uncharacterized protein BT62DRAFT_924571 [Guyanagaster necrorhizus MCA 3950]KAG7439676.1 hypothetical protein BT62DRAFT_924571 [Guyanagaster necrorhizus MCA 3950]
MIFCLKTTLASRSSPVSETGLFRFSGCQRNVWVLDLDITLKWSSLSKSNLRAQEYSGARSREAIDDATLKINQFILTQFLVRCEKISIGNQYSVSSVGTSLIVQDEAWSDQSRMNGLLRTDPDISTTLPPVLHCSPVPPHYHFSILILRCILTGEIYGRNFFSATDHPPVMSSSARSITHWRELFIHAWSSRMTAGVHSVTFQLTPGARNEDRFVVQEWLIDGRRWKFLAVFDGHGGAHIADYAAANLPRLIKEAPREVVKDCLHRSRDTLVSKVKKVLRQRIEEFDEEIGEAVKNLCSDPFTLNYPEAVTLVDANKGILQRAFSGSMLALALIDEEQENMWLAGLGDSTVVISCEDPDGIGYDEGLLTLHSTCTPKEYLSIAMMHPSEEKETIMENEDGIRYYNVMPPYVLNSPSTHFINLTELQLHKSTLILYTHGVDAIVDGEATVGQRVKKLNGPDPSVIVGRLVGSKVDDAFAQETLGHSVEVGWMGPDENQAVELLGNLVAGTSAETFAKFLGPGDHGQRDDMMILQYELVSRT